MCGEQTKYQVSIIILQLTLFIKKKLIPFSDEEFFKMVIAIVELVIYEYAATYTLCTLTLSKLIGKNRCAIHKSFFKHRFKLSIGDTVKNLSFTLSFY